MEQLQRPDNQVRLTGRLQGMRQRWTPDGSLALIAELMIDRPPLGPARAGIQDEQPMPLRAEGRIAETLLSRNGQQVILEGRLRRRYYNRDGSPCWGQVEIWVEACRLAEQPTP